MATTELRSWSLPAGLERRRGLRFQAAKGLSEEIVREMSLLKKEPEWMLEFRLRPCSASIEADGGVVRRQMPDLDFDDIYYYIKPTDDQVNTWDSCPRREGRRGQARASPRPSGSTSPGSPRNTSPRSSTTATATISRLRASCSATWTPPAGVPRHRAEVVRQDHPAERQQVRRPELRRLVGRSFIYVPPGVSVEMPLQAYFRINAENMGQFERTLIIADEGSRSITSKAVLHRSTRPIPCTRRSSSWSPSPAAGSRTRPSRTGPRTSTTSSRSGHGRRPRLTSSGSTATSAPVSP